MQMIRKIRASSEKGINLKNVLTHFCSYSPTQHVNVALDGNEWGFSALNVAASPFVRIPNLSANVSIF